MIRKLLIVSIILGAFYAGLQLLIPAEQTSQRAQADDTTSPVTPARTGAESNEPQPPSLTQPDEDVVPRAQQPSTLLSHPPSPFPLGLPVECSKVESCFIQKYVDVDPGPGWRDYSCGHLSNDGHRGTDFRVKNKAQMRRNIPVLAAADGVVKATREGMEDIEVTEETLAEITKQGCGNAVILTHADGWQTEYCHLRKGSVKVRSKQAVAKGEKIGYIGLSGLTEYPHLHFGVRHKGIVMDPFTGQPMPQKDASTMSDLRDDITCDPRLHHSLWDDETRRNLGYIPTAILGAGFMNSIPTEELVREGDLRPNTLPHDSDVLIFWTDIAGLRKGDVAINIVTDPDGAVIASQEQTYPRPHATMFKYIGTKKPAEGWKPGQYKGVQRLMRDGEQVLVIRDTVEIVK